MQITLRFYEELNHFLPVRNRKKTLVSQVNGRRTVKDLIESYGIPHTEVDLIIVNGSAVGFEYFPASGDHISVYPMFESFDISPLNRLRPEPLRQTKFILDVHLGKLARKLRMTGFDTLYQNDYADDKIIEIATADRRIILTRDIGILKNSRVTHGYFVRATNPELQLMEVIKRFDLSGQVKPLSRCIACNGQITSVQKETINHLLPPKTKIYFNDFFRCKDCQKIYWEGSHYERMLHKVKTLNI